MHTTRIALVLLLIGAPQSAASLECLASPPPGYAQWREIEGRKCWYSGQRRLPKSELHWPKEKPKEKPKEETKALTFTPPPSTRGTLFESIWNNRIRRQDP